jgi:hypothetical protein
MALEVTLEMGVRKESFWRRRKAPDISFTAAAVTLKNHMDSPPR